MNHFISKTLGTEGPNIIFENKIEEIELKERCKYFYEKVAYTIDNHQNQSLVNDILNQLKILDSCKLHSNQGAVYTSYEYYKSCEEKGIMRSMSRKGTTADNALIECFHCSLKSETFYLNKEHKSSNNIVFVLFPLSCYLLTVSNI